MHVSGGDSGAMPNAGKKAMATALAVATCLGSSACGSSKKEAVVVRVGDHAITAATVDHWIRIESVTAHGGGGATKPLPKGVMPVPPEYSDCIAYLVKQAAAGPTPTKDEARVKCAVEYKLLKETILGILISYIWDSAEAAAKGVHVSDAEVTHYLKQLYPHPGEFGRHLKITHETLADDRMLVRSKLLRAKLNDANARNTHSEAERLRSIAKEIADEAAKWTPQTSCKPGYVVSQCRQYRGPQA
jgi:hypothetical protein